MTENTDTMRKPEGPEAAEEMAQRQARDEALKAVLRIKPEELSEDELNLAAGLLLGLRVVRDDRGNSVCELCTPFGVERFEPLSDWMHYGYLVTNKEFVVGSHATYDDANDMEKVTGRWFSAHSFFRSTKCEGHDLREVVAQCAAKRLAHEVKYPPGR